MVTGLTFSSLLAVAVWASAGAKDLEKVEQMQIQCLRRVIGAKAHSSGSAVEVITGSMPMRIRIRELCSRICASCVRMKLII